MKVIYLHQYFNTPQMPGGTRSYEMARRLVRAGHEVHMVTSDRQESDRGSGDWYRTEEDGVNVHWLPVRYDNRMAYGARIKAFFRFAFAAASRARRLGGDVVFATSTPLTIAIPAVYAAKRNKIPMVFEVRDLWPEIPIAIGALKNPVAKALARWLERFAYNNAAQVVALSPGMKEGVAAAGYPESQVKVIPNSCDIGIFDIGAKAGRELRAKYDWLGNRLLVIYTGTLGTINGVGYFVHLAAAVEQIDPEIRFLVIGAGIEENAIRDAAIEADVLGRNFFMFPSVPKTDIPNWLSAADIATSFFIDCEQMWTNSANKFFDALAAGKPIAINYRGWQADILSETGTGLILDPQDIDSSAKMLVSAAYDEEWRSRAGIGALELAKERFDRNELAVELELVLEEAVSGRVEHQEQRLTVD